MEEVGGSNPLGRTISIKNRQLAMTARCPFCTLPPERIVLQNNHAIAIRDAYPVSPGHTLIIPKRHIGSFFETTADEKQDLFELLELAKTKISPNPSLAKRGTTESDAHFPPLKKGGEGGFPDAFNIGINDGAAAGQTVPHLHIHLIPRYKGDMADPRGGVRWVIPDKAKYW